MGEFIKKYQVFIILSFILGYMLFIKFSYRYQDQNLELNNQDLTPTVILRPTLEPSPIPLESEQAKNEEFDQLFPLWKLLPYQGKGFTIDRYVEALTLSIKLEGVDQKLVEPEIYQWLEENKVASESHKLVFE